MPCFGIIRLQKLPKTIGEQQSIVLEQIVTTRFGIPDQFSYPVQARIYAEKLYPEKRQAHIGLYGSPPPPPPPPAFAVPKACTR